MDNFERNGLPVYGIPIRLLKEGRTILMIIRDKDTDDRAPAVSSVVFADPDKLRPLMQPWIGVKDVNRDKHAKCARAFQQAETKNADPMPICKADDCPVPLALVECLPFPGMKGVDLIIDDGATRIVELLERGAEFVPLQTPSSKAQLLHQAVGKSSLPKPSIEYVMPPDIRAQTPAPNSSRSRQSLDNQ